MPTRTGKANQPKEDESPEVPAVPIKHASDEVQKMSEDESDTVEDSLEKVEKMSEEESDTMDVSTDKAKKMSDVVGDSTKKDQEILGTKEDSSEKAQKTPDAGDDSSEEAQKMSGEESEAADESTEDVLLNTLTDLDFRTLLIPVGKNKVGELYFWQSSYPISTPVSKIPASGSLKWHQKEESGNTLLLDASLAMSDDYRFLQAVVDESESTEESSKKRVVWRKPTSQLIDSSCPSEGTMVWQARTTLTHSADLAFQARDLEQRRRVLLVPFNPDVAMKGSEPGSEEGSLGGNQSPRSAEASSEAETSDDVYAESSPKKPRLE